MTVKSNPPVLERFKSPGGKARLLDVFRQQRLIAGDLRVAQKFLKCAELLALQPGEELISQGASDNDFFFVLSGSLSVTVNARDIAERTAGDHVGEIALLDPTAVRSATVQAKTPSVVARIRGHKFEQIANKEPSSLWRRIALDLGVRLRQRNRFHTAPRKEPAVFIASSSEGLEVANCVHQSLLRRPTVPRLWTDGVFQLSKTTIEDLMGIARQIDFAIIVMTADDMTHSRGKKKESPRDNVVFELGLFMGAITRERTFILAPHGVDLKIPTDLLGVTLLRYRKKKARTLAQSLQPVTKALFATIQKLGPL